MDEAGGLTWALILTVAMGTHAALSDDAALAAATQQKILETAGSTILADVAVATVLPSETEPAASDWPVG